MYKMFGMAVFSVGMDTGQFGLKISQFSFDPLVVVRTYLYDSKVGVCVCRGRELQ